MFFVKKGHRPDPVSLDTRRMLRAFEEHKRNPERIVWSADERERMAFYSGWRERGEA